MDTMALLRMLAGAGSPAQAGMFQSPQGFQGTLFQQPKSPFSTMGLELPQATPPVQNKRLANAMPTDMPSVSPPNGMPARSLTQMLGEATSDDLRKIAFDKAYPADPAMRQEAIGILSRRQNPSVEPGVPSGLATLPTPGLDSLTPPQGMPPPDPVQTQGPEAPAGLVQELRADEGDLASMPRTRLPRPAGLPLGGPGSMASLTPMENGMPPGSPVQPGPGSEPPEGWTPALTPPDGLPGAPGAQLEPQQTDAPKGLAGIFARNPNLGQTLLMAGLGMMAAGGRPGATFLGAAGEGGLGAFKNLQDQRRLDLQEKRLERAEKREDTRLAFDKVKLIQGAQDMRLRLQEMANQRGLDRASREKIAQDANDLKELTIKAQQGHRDAMFGLQKMMAEFRIEDAAKTHADRAAANKPQVMKILEAAGIDPASPQGKAALDKALYGQGMEFTSTGADGATTTFTMGGGPQSRNNPSGLSPAALTKLDSDMHNANEAMAELNQQKELYKPEYSSAWTQGKMWARAKAERWLDADLEPKTKEELKTYSKWRSATGAAINHAIQRLTGAAMTDTEAVRIKKVQPSDEDSHSEYLGKLEQTQQAAEAAMLRARLARKMGYGTLKADGMGINLFNPDGTTSEGGLRALKSKVDAYGDKLAADLKSQNPGMDDKEISEIVLREIRSIKYGR